MPAALKIDCKSVDAELDRQFGRPGQPVSPLARQHLDECERCTKLYRYLTQPARDYAVSPELQRRILENAKRSLQPVSPLRSTAVRAAQLLIVFVLLAAAVTSMRKILGIEAMSPGQLAGSSAVLALGVVLLSRSLAWQMIPGSMQRIPAWTAVAILGAALLVGTVVLFPWQTPEAFVERGWRCLRTGLTLSVPTAVLFWQLVRRGAFLNFTTLGASLGAIAGLLSVTVLQFTCNMQEIAHLLVWHGGVLVIATIAGALIGRSVGRLRRSHLT
jgi:predicted anti-sigma-YlaC factor YlaD